MHRHPLFPLLIFPTISRINYPISAILVLFLRLWCSSSDADDASGDQFLDLGSDSRVLHVLLESSWVALCLLEDALHNRVLHDVQDLETLAMNITLHFVLDLPRGLSEFAPWSAPPSHSRAHYTLPAAPFAAAAQSP